MHIAGDGQEVFASLLRRVCGQHEGVCRCSDEKPGGWRTQAPRLRHSTKAHTCVSVCVLACVHACDHNSHVTLGVGQAQLGDHVLVVQHGVGSCQEAESHLHA